MNKRVLHFIFLFAFFFASATAYSQAVTMSAATGGLAATPQPGGATNIAIFGVQLNKAAGAGNTVTSITVAMTTTPVGKFTNARLYESTDATFSGVGTETLVATGTISATDISFTGAPLSNFDGLTTADDEFFFVVVDVDPSVTAGTTATQPSLAGTSVVVTTGTTAGATITGTNYAFVAPQITLANLATGLAASPLQASATNQGIFGFSLTSTGTQTVTAINVQVTGGSPATKWTTASYKLITSTDASLATAGDNSAPIGGLTFTPSATEIAITGLSQVITTGTNYFLMVDVEPGVTGATTAIQPSLGNTNITSTPVTGTVTGTATGTNYSFTAPILTIANLSTGLAASPLIAGATGQGVFGFSLTSNGTQTVSAINVQVTGGSPATKWTNASYQLITSTDASFATTGDNSVPIGGLTFTPSATEIAITGLSQVITTGTNYFLVVSVEPGVTTATTAIQPSLAAANITTLPGTVAGSASGTSYTFAPLLTIVNLSTGLAGSPLIAGATGQGVFGFSLTSSASQTVTVINVQVSGGSPATKWTTASYALITSTDASFATTGDNSAPIGGLTFTPTATQIGITGLSQVVTTGTNYFLVVNIDPAVTGATTAIQPSLGAANVTITTGGGVATGSATGTNYSFSVPTATFTEITAGTAPVISGTILSAGTLSQVLTGFSVTSNSTQQITAINFNYSPSTPTAQFAVERLFRSTIAGSVGTEVTNDVTADGDFTGLTETINGTPVYFYLVVDVNGSATSGTPSVTVAPTQANIAVSSGNKNALSINRTFTFETSQNSNIILNAGTTDNIDYINKRTGTPLTSGNSASLATFRIQDGGGVADADLASTTLSGLTILLSNTGASRVRRIALFDDGGNLIGGTQQDVSGTTVTWSGLSIVAADAGFKDFTVRATFLSTVGDNEIVDVTIQSATAPATGSRFATGDAGAASSTSAASADANRIEVTASALAFTGNPPNTPIATDFSLTLQAKDAQNNIDQDFTSQVALTKSPAGGTLTVNPPPAESLTPNLVGGSYTWNTLRISQSGTYTLTASDDAYDDNFTNPTATVTITTSASSITLGTTTPSPICYGTFFAPLGSIIIAETDPGGISGASGTYTFSLGLPAGFIFDPTVASGVTLSTGPGHDISAATGYTYLSSNTVVQFSFNLGGTANTNTITIGGLKVGHPHPGTNSPVATGTLNLTRAGGSATIAGVTPGTVLGTVSASQQNGAIDFTVDQALVTDPPVDPATTTFNVSSAAVKLVPNVGTGTIVFSGSGVTFSSPDYRFNPSSLSSGIYPITMSQTAAGGCQSYHTKDFEVLISGIANLNASYCTNAGTSTGLDVADAYIDQIMGEDGWSLDHLVYFDWNIGGGTWVPITQPDNTSFDPSRTEYLLSYQTFRSFGYPGLAVGFVVCNSLAGYPCGSSTYVATYQWVDLKTAPKPSFTIPKTAFCLDDIAVNLTGTPPNSNIVGEDKFTTDFGGVNPIAVTPSDPRVWSFSPAPVAGAANFNIFYTRKDPATGCSSTSDPIAITVNPRPSAVGAAAITSGVSQTLCQGIPVDDFEANPVAGTTYNWYSDNLLTTSLGSGNTFLPGLNTATAPPVTNFYVTRTIAGCESNREPTSPTPALQLAVNVIATPVAPAADRPLEYCINQSIPNNDLLITTATGTVKWYIAGTSTVQFTGSNPSPSNLGIDNTVAGDYFFELTQTESVNGCEGPVAPGQTKVSVKIKPLPVLSIVPDADPLTICKTDPPITFTAYDGAAKALDPPGTVSWTGVSAIVPNPPMGTAQLDPSASSLTPGNYVLTLNYTTSGTNCSNSTPINLTVLPSVTPSVSIGIACDSLPVSINNTSQMVPLATASTISSISWSFGDGGIVADGGAGTHLNPIPANTNGGKTTGTYKNPNHIYSGDGTFQLNYTITTSDGCIFSPPAQSITINKKPQINFTWANPCYDSSTSMSSTRFTAAELTTPSPLPISTYTWDFNVNSNLTHINSPGGASPTVNYDKLGSDSVSLIVITAQQCRDTVQKVVYVLPTYKAITDTSGYDQNFNNGNDFWFSGGVKSSWALGNTIAGTEPSDQEAWATGLASSNNINEHSWVMSGCFNFKYATNPVVSLDIWSDTPFGVDGAVFQYNDSDTLENEAKWKVLGDVGTGINWYDGSGISNSPGNQTSNDYGWTGIYPSWKKAIYKLDDVKPANSTARDSLIVFRIAFAAGNRQQSGFAFDNVFIGERSRVVLLESFTNTSDQTNINVINAHNNKYETFGDVSTGELVKIQYHTAFPGTDMLNGQNQQMNNSRAAFYGITEAPAGRVDGGYENGPMTAWLNDYNDDRVLTPSIIRLDSTGAKKSGDNVKIGIQIQNTSSQNLPLDGLNAFVVIVQKEILRNTTTEDLFGETNSTEFVYVAKQMLPSAAGTQLTGTLAGGAYLALDSITWSHPNGGDAIVVFIQKIDGENKPVLQAFLLENPPTPNVITGTEDPEYAKNIYVFPNPANHEVNIQLPAAVTKPTPVALSDAYGRVVYQSAFKTGEQTMKVSTSTLADGIYMMQIITPQGNKALRKVMVKH